MGRQGGREREGGRGGCYSCKVWREHEKIIDGSTFNLYLISFAYRRPRTADKIVEEPKTVRLSHSRIGSASTAAPARLITATRPATHRLISRSNQFGSRAASHSMPIVAAKEVTANAADPCMLLDRLNCLIAFVVNIWGRKE